MPATGETCVYVRELSASSWCQAVGSRPPWSVVPATGSSGDLLFPDTGVGMLCAPRPAAAGKDQ